METHSTRVDILKPTEWNSISCYSVHWKGPIRFRLPDDNATKAVIATRSESNKSEFVLQTLDLENHRESHQYQSDWYRIEQCNYLWFLNDRDAWIAPEISNVDIVLDD